MSGWRTMQVDGRAWRYRFGEGSAVIRFPDGGKSVVDYATLTGCTPDIIERGQWKGTSDGAVRPGHVRGWIRRNYDGANMAAPSVRGESHKRRPSTPSDRPPVGPGDEPGSLFDRLEER